MKAYEAIVGFRTSDTVVVHDGLRIYTLEHHVYHSPDGHSWGYGGSGPSELAKDILWDLLTLKPTSTLYQAFKWEFVAQFNQDKGWVLQEAAIRLWLSTQPGPWTEAEQMMNGGVRY